MDNIPHLCRERVVVAFLTQTAHVLVLQARLRPGVDSNNHYTLKELEVYENDYYAIPIGPYAAGSDRLSSCMTQNNK